ncbi:holo-ACP synthase [Halanaerobium sp. Z-7514]|uniref:Holo-[acyl-carrier-protein] synthase n=1 Tax=Halanaerobium polyolivorans TaxID=2886943 RepID=A0AAW4WWH4_9FIRM|nr:holo-ACP synthase [Halanaerobium polyolivorans]MCC3145040.1 holo-ACP synthase [Halanaerobium polyolivorans]
MIIGTGIDIVKKQRIERLIKKYGERFLQKIYLASEIEYCSKQTNYAASYAARFAAKEALLKALGTGMRNNSWQDIEILNNDLGKPEVKLYNKTAEQAAEMNVEKIFLTISHEKDFSIAQIILEGA